MRQEFPQLAQTFAKVCGRGTLVKSVFELLLLNFAHEVDAGFQGFGSLFPLGWANFARV